MAQPKVYADVQRAKRGRLLPQDKRKSASWKKRDAVRKSLQEAFAAQAVAPNPEIAEGIANE